MINIFKHTKNTPPHWFVTDANYMLTGATYMKELLIQSASRKMQWIDAFQKAAQLYGWNVYAWVVLDTHYHIIVQAQENPANLPKFVASYHKFTARHWNQEDKTPGRKVWWNYWDTCIRSEKDYYARLRYIFWNPVKHGLIEKPEDYPFSSYHDFLNHKDGFDFTDMDEVNDVPEF